jgi:hypothetical protein
MSLRPSSQPALSADQSQPSPPCGSVIRLSSCRAAHFRRSTDLEGELDLVKVLPGDLLFVVEEEKVKFGVRLTEILRLGDLLDIPTNFLTHIPASYEIVSTPGD